VQFSSCNGTAILLAAFIDLVASCLRAAKTRYGTTLANVDFLHGPAESLLTITNLLIGEPVGTGQPWDSAVAASTTSIWQWVWIQQLNK
jgi:Protein of unknown function (DUF3593)